MTTSLLKKALLFEENIKKIAAPKEKFHRKSLAKKLEKQKAQYAKDKKEFDMLSAQHASLTARLEEARAKCAEGRKSIQRLNSAQYVADIASASDIVFHQDSNDISYVIDGKECHVTVDGESGEVSVSPWREYKRNKKSESETKLEEETPVEESMESELEDDRGEKLDESDVDDLYYDLLV